MTRGGTSTRLPAAVELLEGAIGYTLGSLLLVTPEHLDLPTPCSEWNLAALLDHMNDSLSALYEAATSTRIDLEPVAPTRELPLRATAMLKAKACRLLGDWSRLSVDSAVMVDDRPLDRSLVAVTGAVEVAVHGWDVARSLGRPQPIPPRLAADLLELAPLFVTGAGQGTGRRFAPPVPGFADAGPGDRLLAITGRDPKGRPEPGRTPLERSAPSPA